jgi:hypothetical protein
MGGHGEVVVGKRSYAATEASIARRLAKGRGSGEGASFKPFLTIRDVPSLGRRARILGRVTGRVHHLMSDLECRQFLEFDWRDDVVDIREQHALDRHVTRRIAAGMNVRHPSYQGVDVVMTTDLVAHVDGPDGRMVDPVSVKYAEDQKSARVRDKLAIERRYWDLQGWPLRVVSEEDLPKARAETLAWLLAYHHVEHMPWPSPGYWRRRGSELVSLLRKCPPEASISDVIARAEGGGGYDVGEVMSLIRFLACAKVVAVDLDRRFDVREPVSSIMLGAAA